MIVRILVAIDIITISTGKIIHIIMAAEIPNCERPHQKQVMLTRTSRPLSHAKRLQLLRITQVATSCHLCFFTSTPCFHPPKDDHADMMTTTRDHQDTRRPAEDHQEPTPGHCRNAFPKVLVHSNHAWDAFPHVVAGFTLRHPSRSHSSVVLSSTA